ncbi:MAG: type II toxin-antitoxin system RelE/ParE family toxin [Coriobacteriia bacterium]|nr:type II toxin-antitoxin system RelE/ParE family toxin [Coriobacteriia bacterium]
MTRRIEFTRPAESQFLSALAYIRAERPSAAREFRDRAARTLSNLIEFPESGRIIPEFPSLGFREVLVDRYRFFYKPVGDVIWVVGTWHDAQIPAEPSEPGGI